MRALDGWGQRGAQETADGKSTALTKKAEGREGRQPPAMGSITLDGRRQPSAPSNGHTPLDGRRQPSAPERIEG